MNDIGKRLLQTLRLERDAFVWMDFNDRATGDAVILIAITRVLIQIGLGTSILGFLSTRAVAFLELYLRAILGALVFWLVYSGITWAVGRYIFQGGGAYALVLRIAGFAYPTLLLLLVTVRIFDGFFLALLVGSIWFMLIVGEGMRYAAGLERAQAYGSAAMGMVGYLVVAQILNFGF